MEEKVEYRGKVGWLGGYPRVPGVNVPKASFETAIEPMPSEETQEVQETLEGFRETVSRVVGWLGGRHFVQP